MGAVKGGTERRARCFSLCIWADETEVLTRRSIPMTRGLGVFSCWAGGGGGRGARYPGPVRAGSECPSCAQGERGPEPSAPGPEAMGMCPVL